jgi:hypothetical protein
MKTASEENLISGVLRRGGELIPERLLLSHLSETM